MFSGSSCAAMALAIGAFALGCGKAPAASSPVAAAVVERPALRICADPNNLPFSNHQLEGFENELAALVAADLGMPLEYTWWPQRRGFTRLTLNTGVCDVIAGVPQEYELALTTDPYYTSSYVFVTRGGRHARLSSFDDERLRRLIIGIHVVGDDYSNVPPGDALVARGITANVRGYSVFGDYAEPTPPARLIEAVAAGDVDLAIAWGPLAGYFASRTDPPLRITNAIPVQDVPLRFSISMAVRKDAADLRDRLNGVLARRRGDINALLDRFRVPRVAPPTVASR
jgi:mxaJ protein